METLETLFWISVVFVLLGNTIDGIGTFIGVRRFGIEAEINPAARWLMGRFGLFADLLFKLIGASGLLLALSFEARLTQDPGVISRTIFYNLYYSLLFATGGTGLLCELFDQISRKVRGKEFTREGLQEVFVYLVILGMLGGTLAKAVGRMVFS